MTTGQQWGAQPQEPEPTRKRWSGRKTAVAVALAVAIAAGGGGVIYVASGGDSSSTQSSDIQTGDEVAVIAKESGNAALSVTEARTGQKNSAGDVENP